MILLTVKLHQRIHLYQDIIFVLKYFACVLYTSCVENTHHILYLYQVIESRTVLVDQNSQRYLSCIGNTLYCYESHGAAVYLLLSVCMAIAWKLSLLRDTICVTDTCQYCQLFIIYYLLWTFVRVLCVFVLGVF